MGQFTFHKQTFQVGESIMGGGSFAPVSLSKGDGKIDTTSFTDPNTSVRIAIDLQDPNTGEWWEATAVSSPGQPDGFKLRNGSVTNFGFTFGMVFIPPVSVGGARIRVDVSDAVEGSGLAKAVALGSGQSKLTWS